MNGVGMRGCSGAEARSGRVRAGPAAGCLAEGRRRPEACGEGLAAAAPRSRSRSGRAREGGRPWERVAAGRAEGRGSGQPPALGLTGRGGACGGPLGTGRGVTPNLAAPRLGGGDRYSAAAPAEKLLYWRLASVCRGGEGWAGARLLLQEGAGAPACPRSAHSSVPFLRTSAQSPPKLAPWRCPATP